MPAGGAGLEDLTNIRALRGSAPKDQYIARARRASACPIPKTAPMRRAL